MQEFNEGDLVEAVKGEQRSTDRLRKSEITDLLYLPLMNGAPYVDALIGEGWTITVTEDAPPPRPWLSAQVGETWHLEPFGCNYNVVSAGAPWFTRADVFHGTENISLNDDRITDAVKLERESVTAKKVLDAIRQRIGSIDSAYDFQAVAAEFGVTL